MLWQGSVLLALFLMVVNPQRVFAANVMNYGADGNDYFQFTTPSMAFDKASGFTTLITFAMHVNADGTLLIGGVACTNGVYVGPTNWNSLITTLKTPPTTVNRYEVCVGGWTDTSFDNIKALVAAQGTGPTSILYKNFLALKSAVPGIDAINDDEEQTYDLNSATKFANMLGGLGYKFTMAPYQNQTFWVNLNNSITNCDYVYVQCYQGGAGNDPSQWQTALGSGVVVVGGQESNTANPATFRSWFLAGVQSGFYYPDVVFNSTYWSAAIIEGNGAVSGAPIATAVAQGSKQVGLAWNTVPGAISYNVKRSTVSGGEAPIATVSTANNNWPASNQYSDTGLSTGTTYYYKVSAVNTNGQSLDSGEVSATPRAASIWTGLGSDNNWGTGGNWNSTPNFPTGLTFGGSTRPANTNNLNTITVNSITFDAAAGAFVLNGNDITLNGNVGFSGNPAAPITQTVNLNMAWSTSALDIDTPANANLVFGGAITSSADYSLNKTGAGTLTLGGTNLIAGMGVNGGTNIMNGNTAINGNGDGNNRLYLGDGDFLNGCKGTLVIQPGAMLTVIGSFGDTFVIGRDSGSGTVIQNGGTFTFNPANNKVMLLGATGDTRTRSEYDMNGGLLDMSGNTLSVGWGSTLVTGVVNQVGGVITNLNNLLIPNQSGANGLGVYTLSGGSVYLGAGGITTAGGSSRYAINLGGGTVGAYQSWASSLNMNLTSLNGSVTFDTAANAITLSGALSGNGGLTKAGSGTLTLNGARNYTGDTTVTAGTLQLNVAGTNSGAIRLTNGAVLNLNFAGTNVVGAIYTNNVALPAGVYKAGTPPGFITGAGSLQVGRSGSLLVYEGFDYVIGSLAGQNGGAGWNGSWVDVGGGGGITVASGNLTAGAKASSGFDARSTGNSAFVSNANRLGRYLDCSANGAFASHGLIDVNGRIGANGTSVYISFLQQPNSTAIFYEFELKRDDLGDGGRIAGIGNDAGDNNVHWRTESPAGGSSTFGDLGAGDTGVNYYVVRIDYLNGNDNVYIYRNPTSNTEPSVPTLAVTGAGDLSFNGVSMAAYLNGVTVKTDQIRMGVSWADVVGGPPGFTLQPAALTRAAVHDNVSLSAMAASDLPVKYQWYFTNSLIVGATNSTLTLSNVQMSATGTYFVTASNSLGSANSTPASLIVQLIPSPVMRILPVGDSITAGVSSPANIPGGYRTLLAALLNNVGYNVVSTGLLNVNNPAGMIAYHEGHSGAEIAGVDYCMQGVFDSTDDPDIILLLLGTNDYNNGKGAGATNRLDVMITHLATNRPAAKIIVANLLLRTDAHDAEITNTFNPALPSIVAAHVALGQQVYFTDLRSAVPASGLSGDGIHPNANGYARMATNWFNAITNVMGIYGTTNAPVISHVVSLGGLSNITVTFSKPVADTATNSANFTLSGGVPISAAALDAATKRVVTLRTASPLTPNASYVLTVSNVVDLTAAQTPIANGTTATFNDTGTRGASNNVAEASHFQLAYSLDVPNAPNYSGGATYTVDNHAGLGAFGRVAYYLELQSTNDGPLHYVWVSMNPFTTNLTKIGVPTVASGAVFQQNVTNMNVASSVAGIVTGTNLNGGNLEFWPYNYAQTNSSSVANANVGTYDWGDQNSANGNFGSMQIANHNASQMLLSFNAWGGFGGNADIGIGNNTVYQTGNWDVIDNLTDIQPDWTFRRNAPSYAVKTLQVFIQPVPVPGTTNLLAVLGGSTILATSNLVALAGNPANYPLSVTAVSATSTNGSAVNLNGGNITYTPVALGPDKFTFTLGDGHGGTANGIVTATNTNGLGGQVSHIAFVNGMASMTFTAIPGYQYHVQVSTNLVSWNDVLITNVPVSGAFQFNDNAASMQAAYYRLMWSGN